MQNSPIAHQRVLNYAYVDTDALYQDFQIPQQGYNEKQVEESRIAYGRNVLSGRASDTVLYRLRRAFVNPFTVILFVLAARLLFNRCCAGIQFQQEYHHIGYYPVHAAAQRHCAVYPGAAC